jgi:hypothetical protein
MPPLVAIFLWPLVMLILFKRFSPQAALCWSIIAGYLFLPTSVGLNLPMLPSVNKDSMPSIAAVLIMLVIGARARAVRSGYSEESETFALPGWLPRSPIGMLLVFALIAGAFLTVLSNGDRLTYGVRSIPGLRVYDGFAAVMTVGVSLLPLLLARKFLASAESHKTLLYVLCIAGLIYSLPTLYEVRMSPRLNVNIYGFFPHSWAQHIRGDGFRPLVFLQHGLWLGIFLSGAFLAALGYFRLAGSNRKGLYLSIALWLFITLVLAKSLGALLIATVTAPLMLFLTTRPQLIVASVVAATVLLYPMLRGGGFIPVDRFVSFAGMIHSGRAQSLQYRLNNEDILLEKANQRPFFGWGGWGRSRVYDESGRDISTTDGRWIIAIGSEGWLGYLARFGLLTLPIILLTLRKRKYEVTLATSALSLLLAGNLVDLIPNATSTPLTWLMAGALLGRLELKTSSLSEIEKTFTDYHDRIPRYRDICPVQNPQMDSEALPARDTVRHIRYSRFKR